MGSVEGQELLLDGQSVVGIARRFELSELQPLVLVVLLVGFLWVHEVIIAITQLALSWSVSRWFFADANDDGSKRALSNPAWRGLQAAVGKHLGTAACGGFLTMVLRVPSILLGCLARRA